MDLKFLINQMPIWLLLSLVVGTAVIYSVALQLLFRRWLGVDILSLNNEVAGFKFAVVGVSYAVLLAFVMVVVWEDFRDTEAAVRNEAKALSDLHEISFALPDESSALIRDQVLDYAELARSQEWESMSLGSASPEVAQALDRMTQQITNVEPVTLQDQSLYSRALHLRAAIADNRSERLDGSEGTIPAVLWVVLVTGGLITLSYTSFFASPRPLAQILMTAGLAATVALIFWVSLALNFPFSGQLRISSAPIDEAIRQMTRGQ
jgi:hypothetical protein